MNTDETADATSSAASAGAFYRLDGSARRDPVGCACDRGDDVDPGDGGDLHDHYCDCDCGVADFLLVAAVRVWIVIS